MVGERPSSVVMSARNVLWAQCSLHVWASVSSSTSVGSRPDRREVGLDRRAVPRGRAPAPGRCPIAISWSSGSPEIGTTSAVPVRCRRRGTPARSAANAQRSITGLATTRRTIASAWASVELGRRTRPVRPVAAPRDRHARAATRRASAVPAAPSVTPGRNVTSTPGCGGHRHDALLQQRVDEEAVQRLQVARTEVAFEEDQVGDGDTGPAGRAGCPSCSAADLIAALRGSGSIERIVSRWRGSLTRP